MKKHLTKVSVLGLAVMLITQCCFINSTERAFAEATTENYIVIASGEDVAQEIVEQYDAISETGEAVSVDLTEKKLHN